MLVACWKAYLAQLHPRLANKWINCLSFGVEDEKQRVKRLDPELDELLSLTLNLGDTLKQIFHTIESRERLFSITPILGVGVLPLWVNEWEESDYDINFFPPVISASVSQPFILRSDFLMGIFQEVSQKLQNLF